MSKPRIAYCGMALMGSPMALNLLAAGYPVTVWNRSPDKCAAAVEAGASQAATPAEAADGCDVALLCLTNAAAAEAVIFGDDGVASAGNRPPVVVDFSTIHPNATRQFAIG